MMAESQDLSKLTVGQLKEELKKKGLDTTGKKADLVTRLSESFGEDPSEGDQDQEQQADDVIVEDEDVHKEEGDEEEQMDTATGEGEEENGAGEHAEDEDGVEVKAQLDDDLEEELKHEGVDDEEKEGEEKKDEEMEEDKKEEEEGEKFETLPGYEDLESDPNFMLVKWIDNKIIWVPVKDQIKNEVVADTRWRTVVVYPILIDDLQNPALLDLLRQCLHFHINFKASWSITNKTEEGYIELLFRTFEEAKTVADQAQTIREGIEIKHLGCNDSRVQLISDWRKDKKANENTILSRLLFLGNLPKDVEELQLIDMFPDGMRAIVARKEDRELRGYGYIEYESEEALESAVEKYKELEIEGHKLCVMKCMKEKPIGILSDKQRENIVRKIRGVRNALKYRANQMTYDEQQYQKTFQNRLLEKLRQDTTVRREHGLLPPDRMKMLEEREKKQKEEAAERAEKGGGEDRQKRGGGSRGGGHRGGYNRDNRRQSGGYQQRGGGYRGGRGGYNQRGGGGGGGWGQQRGGSGGWGGQRGGGQGGRGEMQMAMNLLQNLSHALGSQGGGGAGASGYGQSNYNDNWGGGYGGNQQGGGGWGGKRRASNEGFSDFKRRGGGGDGGRRGSYGGGGGGRQNWY